MACELPATKHVGIGRAQSMRTNGSWHFFSALKHRFHGSQVHARVVWSAVHVLEAAPLCDHALAVRWLRALLRSRLLPTKRARWWDRLSIDLAQPGSLDRPQVRVIRFCLCVS